ncbi:glycosyltransferase family 4 protein [Acinetobacter sp. GSS19]|uniref:glycosyltransferase family 4 protein n=1 Tax=Acinetobacter sp. GSS19 TaxID=3020716 RepID=UPI0023605DA2|nr:glycosyltransferase family 1 protein [Acinetobacter sp. GSS19]
MEQSLSEELAKLYDSTCFRYCIWQEGRFVEWTQDDNSVQKRERLFPEQKNQLILQPMFPILSKRNALIALAQGILSLMPSKLQVYFNRLLYSLRPRIIRLLAGNWFKNFSARLRAQSISKIKENSEQLLNDQDTLFSPGDVLISFGADWNYSYYNQYYFLRKYKGVKVITCCYDLIPILYPQYCIDRVASIFTSYFLDIADGSDLILCISRQSERDLNEMLERTGGAKPATHVFYLGDNVVFGSNNGISSSIKTIIQEPFILFVSTIERRKNHEVLYRAYHKLCSEGKRAGLPKLVFVGMPGWGVNDFLKDIDLDPLTQDLIVRLNHVSDAELRVLYDAASFCVFPSLYEGWGLPVGEALSMGKVVICSDRGSLPEVGDDLVLYVDPWDSKTWAEEIYRMATDEAWREQWEQKVKLGYRPRTWSHAALSVKSQIDQLIKS